MAEDRGLLQVLKIDALILIGGAVLLLLLSLLPGQRDSGNFVGFMMLFNFAGVAGNAAAALIFAILRQWQRCLGAVIGAVLFGMVGFGLCLGGLFMLESVGARPLDFH